MVWPRWAKKSRNDWRILSVVQRIVCIVSQGATSMHLGREPQKLRTLILRAKKETRDLRELCRMVVGRAVTPALPSIPRQYVRSRPRPNHREVNGVCRC